MTGQGIYVQERQAGNGIALQRGRAGQGRAGHDIAWHSIAHDAPQHANLEVFNKLALR